MASLPAIEVTRDELHDKLKMLRNGMTFSEVRQVLGGSEFKTESPNSYWRFRMTDAGGAPDPYEIYRGTFADGKLTSGVILPKG